MSPATIAEVLGVSVAIMPTAPTSAEKKRCQKSKESMLCQFRASLATLALAPKRAWEPLPNGRVLTQAELKDHR